MGPPALARVLIAVLLIAGLAIGCARDARRPDIDATWSVSSTPSATTESVARLTLVDAQRRPVTGAHLQLEAQMSHPGMPPLVAPFVEQGDGTYEAAVRFSMAGDWVLVASGQLSDGRRFSTAFGVAGVSAGQ
jgi:hypothetical protein